jgi:hypothetical protein
MKKSIIFLSYPGNPMRFVMRIVILLLTFSLIAGICTTVIQAEEGKPNVSRIIQYRGAMPLLHKDFWGGEVKLKFELYRSPAGGTPFWTETRKVNVGKDGWVKVDLGEVARLPDEAFNTPFRFLSIWHEDVEFSPRKQIASLAYVASPLEKQISPENRVEYIKNALIAAKAVTRADTNDTALDTLVACGTFSMETHPRLPKNWLQAAEMATKLGARLPTFEEWYGAYDGKQSHQLVGMEGHYEWVIPWVYEPTIHGRLQELYRGKPVACTYEELSPMNEYPFRLILDTTVKTGSK